MASSSAITQVLETDVWVKATWEEFLSFAEDLAWEKGKFYYSEEQMRVEMSPVGPSHGRQNSIMPYVVILFATFRNIRVVQFTNTSFRKAGIREFQPDLAYYIGSGLRVPPDDNNSPVDLNEYDPPNLVIEIGASSLLVRDRIPEIIRQSGNECDVTILSDAEYRQALRMKLIEEAGEVAEAGGEDLIAELADLYEVIDALIASYGIAGDRVLDAQAKRREERGGFAQKIMLLRTL